MQKSKIFNLSLEVAIIGNWSVLNSALFILKTRLPNLLKTSIITKTTRMYVCTSLRTDTTGFQNEDHSFVTLRACRNDNLDEAGAPASNK